jgi:hypothetical protein
MKPLIFFHENHIDSGTVETLTTLLPYFSQMGYGHICFETGSDLDSEIKNLNDLNESMKRQLEVSEMHKMLFNMPHSSGIEAASKSLGYRVIFELYKAYHVGKVVNFLKMIKENANFSFYPIDKKN